MVILNLRGLLLALISVLLNVSLIVNGEPIAEPAIGAAREDYLGHRDIPLYNDLYYSPEQYQRIHLHILGLEGANSTTFGRFWNIERPEGYLLAETFGNDTGSTDYFTIGSYRSKQVQAARSEEEQYLFEFDFKALLLYKIDGTEGISFTLFEEDLVNDDLILQVNLTANELPEVGTDYVEYRLMSDVPTTYNETENAELVLWIRISDASIPTVPEEALLNITYNIQNVPKYAGIEYDETVLELNQTASMHDFQDGTDKALVQSWRHVDGTEIQGAILFVLGRNDCFMHSHVVDRLFFGSDSYFKFDLYVVNWRLNGLSGAHRGWLTDAYYFSHNAYRDFDVYHEEIQATLDFMEPFGGGTYDKVLGYAHSTGGTILLNYLVDFGDDAFDGIFLNGPFLDFDESIATELFIEYGSNLLIDAQALSPDQVLSVRETPDELADTPITYLNRNITMSRWHARMASQHPFPWSWRSMYNVPVTAGFLAGAAAAQAKLEDARPILTRDIPAFVLTSSGDDVLNPSEIVEFSQWISESVEIVRLQYNNHDAFLAFDESDEQDAIDLMQQWIACVFLVENGTSCWDPEALVDGVAGGSLVDVDATMSPTMEESSNMFTTTAPTEDSMDNGGLVMTEVPASGDGVPSRMPNFAPSATPTTSSTLSLFLNIVQSFDILGSSAALQDPNSPQYLASTWVVEEDQYRFQNGLALNDPKIIQRYALATLYYSTGGDNWSRCGRNSPSCGAVEWLSEADECDWLNVLCTDDGQVLILVFSPTGNEMIGTLPNELSLLTALKRFLAPSNSIEGGIEDAFEKLSSLEALSLPYNELTGTFPMSLLEQNPSLQLLDISYNTFTGFIPTTISVATSLADVQLPSNNFTGVIPSEIGNLPALANLEIGLNQLVGSLPSEIYGLSQLTKLSFQENPSITGTLSSQISQLQNLTILEAGSTDMGGSIPDALFALTSLFELVLDHAQFTGTLSEEFRLLNATLMDLYLNDNQFSGSIPEAFDYLTALEVLQLQENQLTGSISREVCDERGLRFQQLATLITDCVVECDCCDTCFG